MKATTGHPPKKRNPQDSTRRNVQAGNKRLLALERRLTERERLFRVLTAEVAKLINKVADLERQRQPTFAVAQRAQGYRHSTSFPASIRVKG